MKKNTDLRLILHAKKLYLFFPVLLMFILTQSFVKANDNVSVKMHPVTDTYTPYIDYVTANYIGITNLASMFRPVTGIEFYLPITTNPYAQNNAKSKAKLLADVMLQITNYTFTNVDLWLYDNALDTFYFVNIPPHPVESSFTVPEGTYDIDIWPDDPRHGYHYHLVGCGHYGSGYNSVTIYGVPLNSSCNTLTFDY